MAPSLDHHQVGAGYDLGGPLSAAKCDEGVGGAVDHQGGHGNGGQAVLAVPVGHRGGDLPLEGVPGLHGTLGIGGEDGAGMIIVVPDACPEPPIGEFLLDSGGRVVGSRGQHGFQGRTRGTTEVAVPGVGRHGHHAPAAVGMLDGKRLGDHPTHRHPHDVGVGHA